jgi:hypothetical protein
VKKSTKGHNSVKFGCSKNSFLYYQLHIKVVHPWKFKQNLPCGLRGVAFTRFWDVRTDRRTDVWRDGRTSATLYAPTLWGHKNRTSQQNKINKDCVRWLSIVNLRNFNIIMLSFTVHLTVWFKDSTIGVQAGFMKLHGGLEKSSLSVNKMKNVFLIHNCIWTNKNPSL